MDYREYYEARSRERKRKKRFKMKPRFFFVLAIVLALILVPILVLGGPKEYVITYGAYQTVGEGFSAVIIRDELSYYADTAGQVSYSVVEGQNVRAGDVVLNVYASSYIDKMLTELDEVRRQIKEYQADSLLSKIVDPQLDSINGEIAQRIQAVAGAAKSGNGNIAKAEIELTNLMTQRQNYIKQTSVAQADSTLKSLYSTETELIGRIDAWRTQYAAQKDGRVSVYFDGLESVLGADMVDFLTQESVEKLIAGQKPTVDPAIAAQQTLFRLVNPYNWYLVFTAPSSEWSAGEAQQVEISIDGYSGVSATATVRKAQTAEKTTLVVLAFEKDIGSLIGRRFAHITVGSNTEGLMVPAKAVKQADGQYGVYLTDGTFVPVDILISDNEHYLVLPLEEGAIDKGSVIKAK